MSTFVAFSGKKVDMADEISSFSGSNNGSNSEAQSLSSFRSDPCDDNGRIYLFSEAIEG